jgi:pSer/pThr/pTyr-binding forkhead associated (FHA) protein
MFLKVEIGENPAIYYRFSQTELTLGSSQANSIFINHKSISKKHLKLIFEDDKWFAFDQGSTNGTHLGEEQLIPGKKLELGADIPLLLGDVVTITFVTEAENAIDVNEKVVSSVASSTIADEDKTRIISLTDLRNAKISAEKKKNQELGVKRKKELQIKKDERKKLFRTFAIGLAILGIGLYVNNLWHEKMLREDKANIITKMKNKFAADADLDSDLEGLKVPRKELIDEKRMSKFLNSSLCNQVDVIDLCKMENVFGVRFVKPASYILFIKERDKSNGLQFLKDSLAGTSFPDDGRIYLVLFNEGETKTINGIFAVRAPFLQTIKNESDPKKLESYYTYYPETIPQHTQLPVSAAKSESHLETIDP